MVLWGDMPDATTWQVEDPYGAYEPAIEEPAEEPEDLDLESIVALSEQEIITRAFHMRRYGIDAW